MISVLERVSPEVRRNGLAAARGGLALAAGAFVLVSILLLLPIGGEWNQGGRELYFGLGVVAGLVIANWWKWMHTAD